MQVKLKGFHLHSTKLRKTALHITGLNTSNNCVTLHFILNARNINIKILGSGSVQLSQCQSSRLLIQKHSKHSQIQRQFLIKSSPPPQNVNDLSNLIQSKEVSERQWITQYKKNIKKKHTSNKNLFVEELAIHMIELPKFKGMREKG